MIFNISSLVLTLFLVWTFLSAPFIYGLVLVTVRLDRLIMGVNAGSA